MLRSSCRGRLYSSRGSVLLFGCFFHLPVFMVTQNAVHRVPSKKKGIHELVVIPICPALPSLCIVEQHQAATSKRWKREREREGEGEKERRREGEKERRREGEKERRREGEKERKRERERERERERGYR